MSSQSQGITWELSRHRERSSPHLTSKVTLPSFGPIPCALLPGPVSLKGVPTSEAACMLTGHDILVSRVGYAMQYWGGYDRERTRGNKVQKGYSHLLEDQETDVPVASPCGNEHSSTSLPLTLTLFLLSSLPPSLPSLSTPFLYPLPSLQSYGWNPRPHAYCARIPPKTQSQPFPSLF